MKNSVSSLLAVLIMASALTVQATPMDSETQNMVIDRLERVISNLKSNQGTWVSSNLRLADLLAERARLRFMKAIEAGDSTGGKASAEDRKKATSIYEAVQNRVEQNEQGRILFQLAHLYEASGDRKKSVSLFNRILKNSARYERALVLKARTGLADIQFMEGKFRQAQSNYEIALKDSKVENRGLITYRVAWCQFNQNRLTAAIGTLERLLQTPNLLTKDSTQGQIYDAGFHGDVARDLATFYGRRTITRAHVQKFQDLSPTDQRQELLMYFAGEADRLGQKQAAYDVYQLYLQDPKLSQEQKLEVYVRLAQIRYDMGQGSNSNKDFALAAETYKSVRCSSRDNKCEELQKRMRRYVTELHKSRKIKPDAAVLQAYQIYVGTFPQDTQTAILGAQVALDLKQYAQAASLYRTASDSAGKDQKHLEIALLGEIEAAELGKNAKSREEAYLRYLRMNPNGKQAHEVRYQYAQVVSEQKRHDEAAKLFRELALDTKMPANLRGQSADLALDALAIQKKDADIELWALEFAQAFPAKRAEYQRMSRKALMNQVAQTANNQNSSNREMQNALDKMSKTNLRTATAAEKILHFRNQEILAQKVGNEALVLASLNGLLAEKSLSASDREEALSRKVGLYESRLDFRSAYNTARQMRFPKLSVAQKELRLGTLADLAEMNPNRHYNAALKAGLSGVQAASLRSRLVLSAKNPISELNKQASKLRQSRALYAETVLVVYAKTRNEKALRTHLRQISKTAEGRFIEKQPFYREQRALSGRVARHRLNGKSQVLMKRTIDQRVKLLADADRALVRAVRMNDFTAQVMALTVVERENERMVKDLMGLPVPPRLNAAQKAEYMALLEQQSRPFGQKAQVARQKLMEFWGNERALGSLIAEYNNARPEVKPLLRDELRVLAEFSGGGSRNSRLQAVLRDGEPSRKELLDARTAVRQDPKNKRNVQRLRELETKIGHPLMATYLENRLAQ